MAGGGLLTDGNGVAVAVSSVFSSSSETVDVAAASSYVRTEHNVLHCRNIIYTSEGS